MAAPHEFGRAMACVWILIVGCKDAPEPGGRGSGSATADRLLVTTDHGQVRGNSRAGIDMFRGIPYAAPPIGPLRFRAPQPPATWAGVRDATRHGTRCSQPGVAGTVVGDEDCLTLNIWRPAAPTAEPRPVMLFLHGGGNVIGSGSHQLQDARRLAKAGDVIVVSINYRLGLFGFLAHPGLTAESETSGNWAYLDQIAALEWVARNIAAFGGDPERVTLFGESAGALGVCVLLASPLAAGLFDAAIMQSGGCDVAPLERREHEGLALADAAGCGSEPDPVACLRGLSVERLVELAPAMNTSIQSWELSIGGAIDGVVLPDSPWAMFAAGRHNVVPTMIGSNAQETRLFSSAALEECSAYARAIGATFGPPASEELAEYPCEAFADGREAFVAVTTDAVFTCQARRVLRALAPAAAAASKPLFRYRYAYTRADPAVSELQAFHGAELQLLFGTMERLGQVLPESELTLADTLRASWTGFARSGSPVHAGTPGWAAYEVERDNAVVFDVPVSVVEQASGPHCEFWDARRSN